MADPKKKNQKHNSKSESGEGKKHAFKDFIKPEKKKRSAKVRKEVGKRVPPPTYETMRLNRYLALCGVASRRAADELIAAGKVKVNGKVETNLGTKVTPGKETVEYNGKKLMVKTFVYLLMNKPKNHISTVKDDKGRRTVMDIVRRHTRERVFPVGRLDRNTTGLLLFTNDGQLAEKLMHPSANVKKIYHVKLDRAFLEEDMDKLSAGIVLEDGPIKVDDIGFVEAHTLDHVGVEIHSGRNRIVRRMFEHLGYEIKGLDRTVLGPLTKKNLPRGTVRPLEQKEIGWLNMLKN